MVESDYVEVLQTVIDAQRGLIDTQRKRLKLCEDVQLMVQDHSELLVMVNHIARELRHDTKYAHILEWIRSYNDGDMGSKG